MSLLDWPKKMLGGAFSKGSVIATVGGAAAGAVMKRKRKQWEKFRGESLDEVLDCITPYDIARGAGKLLSGWLRFSLPTIDTGMAEKHLRALLAEMDREDANPEDRARSRYILSKAMFYLEGFRLKACRYEALQRESRDYLRKNPVRRNITRREVFLGLPFEAEALIGVSHRILLMLSEGKPKAYLSDVLENGDLRDDADYMARLIAMTYGAPDGETLERLFYIWFEEYRTFKIEQTHRQEAMINTTLSTATGGLPGLLGTNLLGRGLKTLVRGKKK